MKRSHARGTWMKRSFLYFARGTGMKKSLSIYLHEEQVFIYLFILIFPKHDIIGIHNMVWRDHVKKTQYRPLLNGISVHCKNHDCFFQTHSAGKLFDDILDHTLYRVLIFPNGSVNYYTGGVTTLFCQMDITFYPFDLQSCYLHLSSWASFSNQLKIGKVHEHMSLAAFANSGQWILSETTVSQIK